jgi:1,4-alpha-glucan branching enzyme
MPTTSTTDIEAIVAGRHGAPFDVLGVHAVEIAGQVGMVVRAFLPDAQAVQVVRGSRSTPMERVHEAGFFEAAFPEKTRAFRYRLDVTWADGTTSRIEDPYRFPPILSEYDLHLFGEGTHYRLYTKLGAHPLTHAGVRGVSFAVWAPHAVRVSVIGSFNRWDERRHPMRLRGTSGVWELFVPALADGALYKYHILTRYQNAAAEKADPYGFFMEQRPETASIVYDLNRYHWNDAEWMAARAARHAPEAPLAIYEVHLGSWRRVAPEGNRWLTYRELADLLIPYVGEMGYTHIELLPVAEHPFDGSWGYQIVGYFAPTSRFGTPDDFRHLVDRAHQAGLGVLLDWVPAHFPKDAHGLGFFDGTHLYEHADPRKGHHQDWNTFIYNYGRREVCEFLYSNALYWLDQYHIDGLRVDAVASMLYLDYSRKPGEWVPNRFGGRENLEAVDFIKRVNEIVHAHYPDVLTIAEESTAWPRVSGPVAEGGLGFDLKWNMGWMHDTLEYARMDPLYRRFHQQKLTFSLLYAFSEKFVLPLSHDEVVHGKLSLLSKMPGDVWRKFANLRALYAYMYAHPGKKLLFMGGEFGQWREWHHDRQLDWELLETPLHAGLSRFVADLNRLYTTERALYEVDFHSDGFQWIDFRDATQSVVALLRRATDASDCVIVVANFTPVPREGYRVGVPAPGRYRQLLNSDAAIYGGSDLGVVESVPSESEPWHGHPHSLLLTLPPLAVVYFRRETA